MAKMYPEYGHKATQSRAELDLYQKFKTQLPDSFTVIHSLPWLAEVAREVDGRDVPTGEIDFLIIHEELGILAIEVKGGIYSYDRTEFVYKRTGQRVDPLTQVRRGTHSLGEWLGKNRIGRWKIGYCIFLPHSEVGNKALPPALIDRTIEKPQPILLDIKSLRNLKNEIVKVMTYWKKSCGLEGKKIQPNQIKSLVEILLPTSDYAPCWETIIENDTITWLKLTSEQSQILKKIREKNRFVITGYPGTGKTLLLIECARQLTHKNKRILILTYNRMLSEYLRKELPERNIDILTFHEQCRKAASSIGAVVEDKKVWYEQESNEQLFQAVEDDSLDIEYDALLVDEGQAIKTDWWFTLVEWFEDKKIIVACDPTQSFSFESSTSPRNIARLIHSSKPYHLTINLRSPKKVFDRILEAMPPEYQQFSPRNDYQDRLKEYITDKPRERLDKIIDSLEEEKIPKNFIRIITACSQKSDQYRSIQVVSSRKFRGLEAPVIIVIAGYEDFEEAALFCAYTRSTSRCFVIYNALELSKDRYGGFGETVRDLIDENSLLKLADSQEKQRRKRQIKQLNKEREKHFVKNFIFNDEHDLLKTPIKTIDLNWSNDWQTWIIQPREHDYLERYIWRCHLILTTPYPVITWEQTEPHQCKYYPTHETWNGKLALRPCSFETCPRCNRLSPFDKEDKSMCYCNCDNSTLPPEIENILAQQSYLENLLLTSDYSPEYQQKISIFLLCLWRIQKMTQSENELIKKVFTFESKSERKKRTLLYNAAFLTVLIDIIKSKTDQHDLKKLMDTHLNWFSKLKSKEEKSKWKNFVKMSLEYWANENII